MTLLGAGSSGSLASWRAGSMNSLSRAARSSDRRQTLVTETWHSRWLSAGHAGRTAAGHRCEDNLRATRARLALTVDSHCLCNFGRATRIDGNRTVPFMVARRHISGFAMRMRRLACREEDP